MLRNTDQSATADVPVTAAKPNLRIVVDDLSGPEIAVLLTEHVAELARHSPADSMHALDLDALRRPEITFWSGWDGDTLAGCAALKRLDNEHAEIKSMRTAATHKRRGVASILLRHLLTEAKARGYRRMSLETGTPEFFIPAQKLYAAHGFEFCEPFGDYAPDPYSHFMTRPL
ncbi:GNAT family N-acetyltransferase [Nocardia colli]|uniref:GNAT family N-acetyltransferase n=1 Tax=Nocardia colli TaxID=2545717 RepID=A0A5N0E5G8_9NOCA|nr:GNAT family N-acetyltransferase [Nocardia colli]KAA8884662.1 GNAT family N-acetyltransferase [Nocardia colli]